MSYISRKKKPLGLGYPTAEGPHLYITSVDLFLNMQKHQVKITAVN